MGEEDCLTSPKSLCVQRRRLIVGMIMHKYMYLYMYNLCTELYFIKTMTVLANQYNSIGESWKMLLTLQLQEEALQNVKLTVNSCLHFH